MSTLFAGNKKKSIAIIAAFALAATLAFMSLYNPFSAFAATTSVDVYLDGEYVATISSSDITTNFNTFNYSTTNNAGATSYRTAYGQTLASLITDIGIDYGDISWVHVYSLSGENNSRWFSNPGTQLFANRSAYLPTGTVPVNASLSVNSGITGGTAGSDDGIRLYFGQQSVEEKNLPYAVSEITRIGLFTSTPSPVPTANIYSYIP